MTRGTQTIIGACAALFAIGCGDPAGLPSGGAQGPLPPVYDYHREAAEPAAAVVIGEGHATQITQWVAPDAARRAGHRGVRSAADPVVAVGPAEAIATPPMKSAPVPHQERYPDGALCTLGADVWGAPCADPGCAWAEALDRLAPEGLEVGRGEKHLRLSGAAAIIDALPGEAPAGKLVEDLDDPYATQVGRLASALVAMQLNILFNRAGKLGEAELGRAILNYGVFEGWSVYAVQRLAEEALTGDAEEMEVLDLDVEILADEIAALNTVAVGCRTSDWIRPPVR